MDSPMEWIEKQLGDAARRLELMGITLSRNTELKQIHEDYRKKSDAFFDSIYVVQESLVKNPEGFHHFDAMTKAKDEFLGFVSQNLDRFRATQ